MNKFPLRPLAAWLASIVALAVACSSGGDIAGGVPEATDTSLTPPIDTPATRSDVARTVLIPNLGTNAMEGHTPRGFRGSGTGLFAGDNLNAAFPDGQGVQLFITFDVSEIPAGRVVSALLKSDRFEARGTPFRDLGALNAAEMVWSRFTPDLWNEKPIPNGASCVFATSPAGPFECDLAGAVQRSIDDAHRYTQFRLRFDRAADSDGQPDMAAFFLTDSNTNEPGIFELAIEVVPAK